VTGVNLSKADTVKPNANADKKNDNVQYRRKKTFHRRPNTSFNCAIDDTSDNLKRADSKSDKNNTVDVFRNLKKY